MKPAKQTRYVSSNGLAFAEQAEMNKLSKLSEEGWFLENMAMFGFRLRRGTAHKLIYCLDIRQLQTNEEPDYLEIFAAGGWKQVCSSGDFHIFAAEPGTLPIHTDRTTMYEKYIRVGRISKIFALIMLLLTLGVSGLLYLSNEVWNNVWLHNLAAVGLLICAMLLVPSIMVYIAYSVRLKRGRQE